MGTARNCCTGFVLLVVVFCYSSSSSVFPDRKHRPGLQDPQKLWWAKEVTPDFHVAGRLTERQMKYASEGGFKSILSLFKYGDKESGDFGGDYLPTTKESQKIAEDCGMQFEALLTVDEDWCSIEAVEKLAQILPTLEKPVLLHCDRGFTITFVLLMHMANLTRNDPTFEPKFDSARFYDMTAEMGLDFTMDFTKEVVAKITGEPIFEKPVRINTDLEDWLDYWLAHPVYKNWYAGGYLAKSHLSVLEFAGFKSVINLRKKFTHLGGIPSQEEVNLLNIRGGTGTYFKGNTKARQQTVRLEETRIDPKKPTSYIGAKSPVNYERLNEDEFGDHIGYRFLHEEEAFQKSSLKYHHFPVSLEEPYEPYFKKNLKEIVDIGKKGAVLVHSGSMERAVYVSVLGAAVQHGLDFEWTLRKTRNLGFPFLRKNAPLVYEAYKNILTKKKKKEEL